MGVYNFIKFLLNNFKALPLVIQLALVIIICAISFSIASYLVLLFYRYRRYQTDRAITRLSPVLQDLTFAYISYDNPENDDARFTSKADIVTQIQKRIRKARHKQLMVNLLVEYKKDLRGNMGNLLNDLFIKLELDNYSLKKLRFSPKYKKIQALTELSGMGISISDVYILPLTQHRSHEVRTIARHSYIKLSKNNPFKFFDASKDRLLIWDQIELFRIITTDENIKIPNIGPWLTYSKNPSIILFCLRLVVQFDQSEAVPAVIRLLDTLDHDLRAAAISCLGKMKADTIEDKIVNIYNDQPLNCRIEIIKALGRFQTGRYIDFLTHEFQYAGDFKTKKNAAKSLVKNEHAEPGLIDRLLQSVTPEHQTILRHCMNPTIKYV